jgi:hypothetical protein
MRRIKINRVGNNLIYITDWNFKQWILIKHDTDCWCARDFKTLTTFRNEYQFMEAMYGMPSIEDYRKETSFINYEIVEE